MTDKNSSTSSKSAPEPRQFGLLTLLLIVTAVASVFSAWRAHREIESTKARIELVRSLSRELDVRDESQFALVYKRAIWEGERKCEIFLPTDHSYRLNVSLEGKYRQPPSADTTTTAKSISLPPGEHTIRHFLYTEKNGLTSIHVYCDDELIYDEVHEIGWLPYNYAFMEKMDEPLSSIQSDIDEPLEIWRGVWQHPDQTHVADRVRGLILWVEAE